MSDTYIMTEDDIVARFSNGWFSGGDVPDQFHTMDGRVIHLNVPLCVGCDHPVEQCGCLTEVHSDPLRRVA